MKFFFQSKPSPPSTGQETATLWDRSGAIVGLCALVLLPLLAAFAAFKLNDYKLVGVQELARYKEASALLSRMRSELRPGHPVSTESLLQLSQQLSQIEGFDPARAEQLQQVNEFVVRTLADSSRDKTESLSKLLDIVQPEWAAQSEVLSKNNQRRSWISTGLTILLWIATLTVSLALGWFTFTAFSTAQMRIRSLEGNANQLLNDTPDGILHFSTSGSVLRMNPAAEKLFGFSESRMLGQPVDQLIPGILKMAKPQTTTRYRKQPPEKIIALTVVAANAEGGNFPVSIKLTRLQSGNIAGFVASLRPLSLADGADDLLAAATADLAGETGSNFLMKLADVLASTLQCSFAAILERSIDNPDFCDVVTLLEDGVSKPEERVRMRGSFAESLPATGRRLLPKRAREEYPSDPLLRRWNANGCYGLALTRFDGHLPLGFLILASRDPIPDLKIQSSTEHRIAQRSAAELENRQRISSLAAEKECLALTLRSIGDGMITMDPAGQILMINPAGERLTDFSESEAIGRPLHEIFRIQHEITRADLPDPLRHFHTTGQTSSATSVILLSATRSEAMIQYSVAPIQGRDGSDAGYVLVFHDLTEARMADEERYRAERLESIGILAGGIAHDFNNLLTGIVGNVSLAITQTPGESPMQTRLKDAENAALRAKDLASQLLTFAKGGAPVRRPGPLGKVIEETTHFSMRDPKIKCHTDVQADLWWADIDESQISQVIANLVINAQQAMPLGGAIHVTAVNFECDGEDTNINIAPGRYTRLRIQDEGTGIPPKYLARIFDPYFTTKPKGSGLGLATSYSIIRNHGGTITVHSEAGKGTRFDIYLPAVEAVPMEHVEPTPSVSFQVVRPGRVLVMDDEEIICDLVREALSPLGLEVDAKHESGQAVAAYQKALDEHQPYDLVILDLTLPGDLGGQEVMQQLKRIHPEVKAIVSSGYANTPIMSDHKSYGFAGMLPKPYRITELVTTVQRILNENESEHQVA